MRTAVVLAVALALVCVLSVGVEAGTRMPKSVHKHSHARTHSSSATASAAAATTAPTAPTPRCSKPAQPKPRRSSPQPTAAAAPDYYRSSHWCGSGHPYLSDSGCAKVFPSSFSRDWVSPLYTNSVPDASQGWAVDTGRFEDVRVNTTAISDLIAPNTNACVILIKRTPAPNKAVYYRYICGAESDTTNAYQPWSSTKVYAAANAGGHIREVCPNKGLPAATTGVHGETPLGDLVSIIVSYDATQGYTSNGLSFYMHDLGGRERLLHQLQAWYPSKASNLSLGGNYGVLAPADLGFVLDGTCTIQNDTNHINLNALSVLVHADLLRRLSLHAEMPKGGAFPSLTLDDVHTIQYGAEESMLFPGLRWGGMSTDTAIYAQSGLPMDEVEQRSQGQWRIFSKLGAGWDSGNNVGEIVTAVYASLPVLTSAGVAVPDAGVEFVLVGRASVTGDSSLNQADATLQQTVAAITKAIYNGQI